MLIRRAFARLDLHRPSRVFARGLAGLAAWAGFFRIDVHLSIIISAVGVKVLLSALTGDKVRRLVQR